MTNTSLTCPHCGATSNNFSTPCLKYKEETIDLKFKCMNCLNYFTHSYGIIVPHIPKNPIVKCKECIHNRSCNECNILAIHYGSDYETEEESEKNYPHDAPIVSVFNDFDEGMVIYHHPEFGCNFGKRKENPI